MIKTSHQTINININSPSNLIFKNSKRYRDEEESTRKNQQSNTFIANATKVIYIRSYWSSNYYQLYFINL